MYPRALCQVHRHTATETPEIQRNPDMKTYLFLENANPYTQQSGEAQQSITQNWTLELGTEA